MSPTDIEALAAALDATLRAVEARVNGLPGAEPGSPPEAAASKPPAPAAKTAVTEAVAASEAVAAVDAPLSDDERALARDLGQAIAKGELSVVFQPLVERTGRTTVGVEALLRWNRAGHGPVSPALFVPLAEKTGQIVAIGEWVLARALAAAAAWPAITVAVNVSAVQLRQPDFADRIEAILDASGFDPRRLELELTETALLGPEDGGMRMMQRLRGRGISLALDDFGTGYSSLTYLRRFPFDKLKIDRGFVDSIATSVEAATIVHAVVSIGRSLGMKVVAEGVETAEQHRFLMAAGVHALQGYLFGRPMPAEAIAERLAKEAADAAAQHPALGSAAAAQPR